MKNKNTVLVMVILLLSTTGCLQNESDALLDLHLKTAQQLEYSNVIIKEGMSNTVIEGVKILNRKPDYRPLGVAMQEVQKLVLDFTTYVDSIDTELYQLAGGNSISSQPNDFTKLEKKQLKNRRIANSLFMHSHKNNQAVGEDIQQKLVVVQNDIIKILIRLWSRNREFRISKEEINAATEKFQSHFKTINTSEENWKTIFNKQSVAAHHHTLMSLKNEVLQSGTSMTQYFAAKVSGQDGLFRNAVANSPTKMDILKGEIYEAEIFLSKIFERSLVTKVEINGEEVPIKHGTANYKTTPSHPGEHSYTAAITMENPVSGKTKTYTKTFKYEVVKPCD